MGADLSGELAIWPTKDQMATILRNSGLNIDVGRYSVRVEDCSHFIFQEYGGDLGDPAIDADAETVEEMLRDARLVSDALTKAFVKHRFEIYDDDTNSIAGYLHYDWPREVSEL